MNPPSPASDSPKPSTGLIAGALLFVVINMWLGYSWQMKESGDSTVALGSAVAELIVPVVVALLFSIGKRFRNQVVGIKVVFWTSVLLLFTNIASLAAK